MIAWFALGVLFGAFISGLLVVLLFSDELSEGREDGKGTAAKPDD